MYLYSPVVINLEYVKKEFNKIKLKLSNCTGGEKYFDPIRKIFVAIMPEETVRQKMIRYMQKYMSVPSTNIGIEEHLYHFGIKQYNGRIDMVITNQNSINDVLCVIECKSEKVFIESMQVIEQAEKYSRLVNAKFFGLVNGNYIQFYHICDNGNFIAIQGIPTYKELSDDVYTESNDFQEFQRLEYCDYFDHLFLKNQDWYIYKIGEDTDEKLVPAIVALDDCILDYSQKLKNIQSDRLKLIEDLGIQYRQYNDRSGGGFGSGIYRIFMLEDKLLNKLFLCGFTITTTAKTTNDPKYGTTDGKSVLILMFNDGDVDQMSAQINLNKYLEFNRKIMTITIGHNGTVTRKGANKNDLFEYIKKYNSDMILNSELLFGTIDFSKPLSLKNKDVVKLFSNLIEYCFYREEYKLNLSKNL